MQEARAVRGESELYKNVSVVSGKCLVRKINVKWQ